MKSLEHTKSIMFADDTNLIYSHSDVKVLFQKVNDDLSRKVVQSK